ncbi:MAG: hypothetical protein NW201_07565 [Gemmatimonadales bacterium]|nr:hypothetical protein [Gemmatimonadales bacterium]
METLAPVPGWVGPTIAVSLVVIALAFVAIAAFALAALAALRDATREGRALAATLRAEAEQLVKLSRGVRRRVRRGVLGAEERMGDLAALYDVVAREVEETALGAAATLRDARTGRGMIGRLRRLLVPRR